MYVIPIRLDVLLNTNQISCCKGKWYVRRFDPDKVENGHIYSSVKEVRKYSYIGFTFTVFVGQAEEFVGGFDSHQQLDNQSKKHSVWDITATMRDL